MEGMTSDKLFGGSFLISPIGSQPQFTPEELSDETKAIGEAARDFMEGEVLPVESALDQVDLDLSRSLLQKAGELGLLSLEIPEAYEGMDLDKKTGLVLLEEMGKQASWSVSYGAHTGIGTLPIVYFGSPEQKAKYLPALASGEKLAAYALTEAGSGSDAMGAKTTAVLDGDHWVLNGSKMWITNAGFADVFIVFAKVDGRKFSAFIVEKEDAGFSTGAEEHKLGIKGSSTRALVLDNVRIPKDRLLGEVGRGHRIAFGILNIGRFKLGAGCTGTAKQVLAYTIKYSGERQQFGKPLHAFGLIQAKLADIATRIFVGEAMNFRTIGYVDEGMGAISWDDAGAAKAKLDIMDEYAMEASIAKVWGSEALFWSADDAVQVFGGYGFSTEYPPEKIYRDNRINRIFEGTNEINRMIIAGALFKRAGNGTLALRKDVGDVPVRPEGPLAGSRHAVELGKRLCAYASAAALEVAGQKLIENQEASARVADMLTEIYAMESAVGRAHKMAADGHRWAGLAAQFADSYVNENWHKVQVNARMLLAEVLEGEALTAAIRDLEAFGGFVPQASSRLRGAIAAQLIEKGSYPIVQY
ncbi:acyl-CoA dehydrogenase family protein [Mesoterricola sediminis]|uniref:Acyl-CoA dehydrogenase n=1 Tax=Mesoterricola sediminis TaxID=2927980 RepID=A0AA48GXE5_9BACT|nr:acyl-CoA dehydrogenase family protein [Mesoterricola sediminis]BDU78044.1 putative acyl-CoA dehydrogenase [Mesoterricola sediminis]